MSHKKQSGNISIYLANKQIYHKLLDDIEILWYKNFNEHLSTSDVLTKSMLFLRQYLQGDLNSEERTTLKKYSRIGN